MTAEEVKALPIEQKLQIMETIWEDLRDRFDQEGLPQSHKDLLDQRRTRVQEGTAELENWDEVKGTFGKE